MITLQLYFNETSELQTFLEKFPDSKKYIEIKDTSRIVHDRKWRPWTKFEDEHIISTYHRKTAKQIAGELQRTQSAVTQRVGYLLKSQKLRAKRERHGKVIISEKY